MHRLRILVGLLGCLAVFGAGIPLAALASNATMKSAPSQASEPCGHCPDCDACPLAGTLACAAACAASLPALDVSSAYAPAARSMAAARPARAAVLHGQSRPPDPFPPRL